MEGCYLGRGVFMSEMFGWKDCRDETDVVWDGGCLQGDGLKRLVDE